ncbi:MAG: hypothetical protein IJ437_07185 [Clostridia bacterium]|nr:hypothetical protein [Clostridia bacterium]
MKKPLTLNELLKKRRELWERDGDKEKDDQLVSLIADIILDNEGLRHEIAKNPILLIELTFSIVNKKRENVPFFFNDVQRDFVSKLLTNDHKKPFFILKGRQQGFTTLITAIMLSFAIVKRNFSGFTLADRDDNTKAIFVDKAKVMYNALPERLKPTEKFNSTNELFFDRLNSSWRVASASANIGRSRTLSFIHYSEIAFFKCSIADLQKSIAQAATDDALCIYETTANGFNDAKALWDSGSCVNLFYEWWRTKEYVSYEYEYLKSADTWLKNRLSSLKSRGLSREQLAWYAKKYSSYIDKSSIRQEYPCTPEEAFVTSGDCLFDKEKISNYLSTFNIPSRRGFFSYKLIPAPFYGTNGSIVAFQNTINDIEFIESDNGYISIVEEPVYEVANGCKRLHPYVIGADTAGTGEDYFCAKVIDNSTKKCVATLHIKHIDEDLFAHQLYCLGKYYNDALIGVEANYSTHPIRVLKSLGYKNLYKQRSYTLQSEKTSSTAGFLTTSITRPLIISNLVSVMRENIYLETDRETLYEMSTFVKRSDGRSAAIDGAHDDLVMASAIARFIGNDYKQLPMLVDTEAEFLSSNFSTLPLQEENYMEW